MHRYPLPRNHFSVQWGGTNIGFCEVSGLSIAMDASQFRDGASPTYSDQVMPGIIKYQPLFLKRAVVKGDNEFFNWFSTAKLNTVERRDIVISLLDEHHAPAVSWKFLNAFAVRLDYSPLSAECSGPMMETLEITHEGMSVEHS